ncbi:MAG: helix-turn-helix domain-containing protein [Erysipelotrichaceae bacterium]
MSQYINEVKIDLAKELLLEKNKTISSISTYLGYSYNSYFSRVFKEITNLSPKDYIKEHSTIGQAQTDL